MKRERMCRTHCAPPSIVVVVVVSGAVKKPTRSVDVGLGLGTAWYGSPFSSCPRGRWLFGMKTTRGIGRRGRILIHFYLLSSPFGDKVFVQPDYFKCKDECLASHCNIWSFSCLIRLYVSTFPSVGFRPKRFGAPSSSFFPFSGDWRDILRKLPPTASVFPLLPSRQPIFWPGHCLTTSNTRKEEKEGEIYGFGENSRVAHFVRPREKRENLRKYRAVPGEICTRFF